jgi:hypothetical protein
MPKLMIKDSEMQQSQIAGSSMQFSAIRSEELEATEYTLVTIVVDISASVTNFADDLLKALKEAINSCKKSPRAENLLLRVVTFNTRIDEVHGFIPLEGIDVNSYDPFRCAGMTALWDVSYNSIGATFDYAKTLIDQDFDANAIVFIVTDGGENASRSVNASDIKNLISEAKRHEEVESIVTVLIGINISSCLQALTNFKDSVNIDQFIDVGEATPAKLAKLAQFVSRSVSSQSQALGSGGASQPLTF